VTVRDRDHGYRDRSELPGVPSAVAIPSWTVDALRRSRSWLRTRCAHGRWTRTWSGGSCRRRRSPGWPRAGWRAGAGTDARSAEKWLLCLRVQAVHDQVEQVAGTRLPVGRTAPACW